MVYKVVFLDWYRTISDSLFWKGFIDEGKLQLIQRAMFDSNTQLMNDWMRGKYGSEQAVETICSVTGLNYAEVFSALKDSCKSMTINDPELLTTVASLQSRGIKVVIATDNMDTFARWTVPSLKLDEHFDGIIDSSTQKALKADFEDDKSLFFDSYLQEHNIQPQEAALIDDIETTKIVKKAGIDFIHYDRKNPLSKVIHKFLIN